MRLPALMFAAVAAVLAVASTQRTTSALGRPGVTPVPCPTQEWQPGDPQFDALPGAKAFFGPYDGGLYRIEIPDNWNGELVLYAHGFVSNGGAQGSALRVGNSPIREHLIKNGYAWAASSYRCNGYVPGQGLLDTMALTDRFTKFNADRRPQRHFQHLRLSFVQRLRCKSLKPHATICSAKAGYHAGVMSNPPECPAAHSLACWGTGLPEDPAQS